MALNKEQRKRVLEMMDELDEQEADSVLSSFENFCKKIKDVLYDIWIIIRDGLRSLWEWIKSRF